ncbi:MAG: hypothetical protein ABFC38_10565 [Methanospirillum sp.]
MRAVEKEVMLTPGQLATVTLAVERFLRAKGLLPPGAGDAPPPAR